MLKFSPGNAKLGKAISKVEARRLGLAKRKIYSVSTRAGLACPHARTCRSQAIVNPVTGKVSIVDGKDTETRCFSASQEVLFKATRLQRDHNFEVLRQLGSSRKIRDRILADLPDNAGVIRINIAGDLFKQSLLDAWIGVAAERKDLFIYAYTKALPFWARRIEQLAETPNLLLTASEGGTRDDLIAKHDLRYARIVYSEAEARDLGLAIDHDDSLARDRRVKRFALLLHGVQPKGSKAAQAKQKLVELGIGGYTR